MGPLQKEQELGKSISNAENLGGCLDSIITSRRTVPTSGDFKFTSTTEAFQKNRQRGRGPSILDEVDEVSSTFIIHK